MRPSSAPPSSVRRCAAIVLATCASMLVVSATPVVAKPAGSTQTAQAIWTDFHAAGNNFGFTETQTYAFDAEAAAGAYTLSVTGPAVSCSGNEDACASTNAPVAPEQPATPAFEVPRTDECAFWTGSALTTVVDTASTTASGINGRGRFTFTWTFTWTPSGTPAEKTAWDLVDTNSPGGATVRFVGRIAGLSAQKTSRASGPKYSFSLLNADGTARLTGLTITADGGTTPVASTVVDASDAGFEEFGIGAGTALPSLMKEGGTTSLLTTGDARTILNGDVFAGNDDGGSGGAALAYAELGATRLTLGEGTFTVTLAGQIKGIDGSVGLSVSVARTVRVQGLANCAT